MNPQEFINWPSDHQRAWNMSSVFLHALQWWSPAFNDSTLMRAASNFTYMVPEGYHLRVPDTWTFEAVPRAIAGGVNGGGDPDAMRSLVSYYVNRADTEGDIDTALSYRMLLIAFCVTSDAGRQALDQCSSAFKAIDRLAVPRMTEGLVLAWCMAMHALQQLETKDRPGTAFALNQRAQALSARLKQRFEVTTSRSDRDFLHLCITMSNILAGSASYVSMFSGRPSLMKPDPLSLTMAQRIEEQTQGQWPVMAWVQAAGHIQ